jgi:hypothetical protein
MEGEESLLLRAEGTLEGVRLPVGKVSLARVITRFVERYLSCSSLTFYLKWLMVEAAIVAPLAWVQRIRMVVPLFDNLC